MWASFSTMKVKSMRLVFLGPPGSGKGTQAAILKDHLKVPHISTGALLRGQVAQQTALGKKAEALMARGELVPDDIMLGMLESRLSEDDVANGFILDGYPRNVAQAKALSELLDRIEKPLDQAVLLDVDMDVLVDRLASRAEQEGRADDTPETVRRRLEVYKNQTEPVIGFYKERDMIVPIDGEGSIEDISERLLKACCINNDQ